MNRDEFFTDAITAPYHGFEACRFRFGMIGREFVIELWNDYSEEWIEQPEEDFEELHRWLRVIYEDRRSLQKKLITAACDGYFLSTYAASIRWDRSKNTAEWMRGLRERIIRVQASYKAACPSPDPGENITVGESQS